MNERLRRYLMKSPGSIVLTLLVFGAIIMDLIALFYLLMNIPINLEPLTMLNIFGVGSIVVLLY